MNTFIFTQRRISARLFAVLTIFSLLLSAFPAAFFVAEAASSIYSDGTGGQVTESTEFATADIDTTAYTNITLSFDFDASGGATTTNGLEAADTFVYGWRLGAGGTKNQLGSLNGVTNTSAVEIGSITNLSAPGAEGNINAQFYFEVISSGGTDNVEITNIEVFGDAVPAGTVYNATDDIYFITIQAAIDAATTGTNDVIELTADVVTTEQVNINKAILLDGKGFTVDAAFVKTDNTNNSAFGVQSDDVTIKNIVVTSSTDLPYPQQLHGINVYSVNGVVLQNITATDFEGSGILVNSSEVTASDITTSGNGWHGINVDQKTSNPAVLNIENTSQHSDLLQLYVDDSTKNVTVNDVDMQYATSAPGIFPGEQVDRPNDVLYTLKTEGPEKVSICHWHENGFNLIEVSVNSVANAHGNDTEDIIPVITGVYPNGQNLAVDYNGVTGAYVLTNDCVILDLVITDPATDGQTLAGTHTFKGEYTDADGTYDDMKWAIRDGCEITDTTYAGNVGGKNDAFSWDGSSFSSTIDMTTWPDGDYCLVLNPQESGGDDLRAFRTFILDNDEPREPQVCSYAGEVVSYSNPVYQNDGDPVDPLRRNSAAIEAGVAAYANFFGKEENNWQVNPLDFFSLGIEGELVYEFTTKVAEDQPGADIAIWEITGGDASEQSDEKAEVLVSEDGVTYVSLGMITGDAALDIAPAGLDYVKFVKLIDDSRGIQGNDGDGYDVDAITIIDDSCADPEPEQCINLLDNGSFETPVVTNSNLWDKFASVAGWIIEKVSDNSATTLELHRDWSSNEAADGAQYAELDGDHSTKVKQSVTTLPGAVYELTWAFAPRHDITAEQNQMAISVGGSVVAVEGPVTGLAGLNSSDWTRSSYTFTAGSSSTEIQFADAGPSNSYGTFLDDARLCLVREPVVQYSDVTMCKYDEGQNPQSGWTLMLLGDEDFSGITGQNGCVTFKDVPVGTYTSDEVQQDNWTNISGLGSVLVDSETKVINVVNRDTTIPHEGEQCTLEMVSDETVVVIDDNDFATSTYVHNSWTTIPGATWIWNSFYVDQPTTEQTRTFEETFTINNPTEANLEIAADNWFKLYVNGILVVDRTGVNSYQTSQKSSYSTEILDELVSGENTVRFVVTNAAMQSGTKLTNPAGILFKLTVKGDKDKDCEVTTTPEETNAHSINGFKWSDTDGDGEWDQGENGINNWGIVVRPMTLGAFEEIEVPVTGTPVTTLGSLTNGRIYLVEASGTYKFANWADEYGYADAEWSNRDAAHGGPGWVKGEDMFTPPTPAVALDLQIDNQNIEWGSYNSGHLYKTVVVGDGTPLDFFVYDDAYGDNEGELDVSIYDVTDYVTYTNSNGYYEVEVEAGDYQIVEIMKDGYTQTYPNNPSYYHVTLPIENSGYDFGNQPDKVIEGPTTYRLDGYKYEVDVEETFLLDGWTIQLKNASGTVLMSTTTDSNGYYYFDVQEGDYEVHEVMETDWLQVDVNRDGELVETEADVESCSFSVSEESEYSCDFTNEYDGGSDPVPVVRGCTDSTALNYNKDATVGNEEAQNCTYTEITTTRSGGGSSSGGVRRVTPTPLVLGAATTNSCPLINEYMQKGWVNNPLEVKKLQLFLNIFKDTFGGTQNPVSGVFDVITDANVKLFQLKYKNEILSPWVREGIVSHDEPTGFVYKTTKWKINSIVCPGEQKFPSLEGEDLTHNVDLD